MAAFNASSLVIWGCSAVLGFFILCRLSNPAFNIRGPTSDSNIQSPVSSHVFGKLTQGSQSEVAHFVFSVSQRANFVSRSRLHRKLSSLTELANIEKQPQTTTLPPRGPSPAHNRVHVQEISDDSSEPRKQSLVTSGDLSQQTQNHDSENLQTRNIDKSWQDQSKSPSTFEIPEQKEVMQSSTTTVKALATKSLRSINVFQKLPQDTTPPPQGPSPIQNRVHLQEISSSSSPSNQHTKSSTVTFENPSPLPPLITSSSKSFQTDNPDAEEERVFQMLPRDTAIPPSGPSPIHN